MCFFSGSYVLFVLVDAARLSYSCLASASFRSAVSFSFCRSCILRRVCTSRGMKLRPQIGTNLMSCLATWEMSRFSRTSATYCLGCTRVCSCFKRLFLPDLKMLKTRITVYSSNLNVLVSSTYDFSASSLGKASGGQPRLVAHIRKSSVSSLKFIFSYFCT